MTGDSALIGVSEHEQEGYRDGAIVPVSLQDEIKRHGNVRVSKLT